MIYLRNINGILVTLCLFLVGGMALAQEDRRGPGDFIESDVYTLQSPLPVYSEFENENGEFTDLRSSFTGYKTGSLSQNEAIQITGYKVMGDQLFYTIQLANSNDALDGNLVLAEELLNAGGEPLEGCEIFPSPMNSDVRPQPRPAHLQAAAVRETVLAQNLRDIAELQDAIVDNIEVEVPALSGAFKGQCKSFIEGENELGPWGKEIVSQILNMNSGQGHNDVPAENFFDVPVNFFKDKHGKNSCPGFAAFSTEKKLGFWVHTFASLAFDESTCRASAVNTQGTDDQAEGLLQINSRYGHVDSPEGKIIGRSGRGIGCNALDQDPQSGRWLTDARDNLACGVNVMGYFLCGAPFGAGKAWDACSSRRPERYYDNRYVYWASPKAGHGESKQNWQMDRMKEFPGCIN